MVESVSRFCFHPLGRISVSIPRVQAQDVAGLLEPGLQSDVSERLVRRSSRGCDVNPRSGELFEEEAGVQLV